MRKHTGSGACTTIAPSAASGRCTGGDLNFGYFGRAIVWPRVCVRSRQSVSRRREGAMQRTSAVYVPPIQKPMCPKGSRSARIRSQRRGHGFKSRHLHRSQALNKWLCRTLRAASAMRPMKGGTHEAHWHAAAATHNAGYGRLDCGRSALAVLMVGSTGLR